MRRFLTLVVLTAAVSEVRAETPPMLRYPAISRNHIAFVYANQIWVAGRDGHAPRRLTDTAGRKFDPRFSPDGRTIAFSSAEFSNAGNVYTVPVTGGKPTRVTYLSSPQVLTQWTADDRFLFHSNALSFIRLEMQLFTVKATGGAPVKLPLPYGSDGAIDDSGHWLAYTPQWPNNLIAHWKRYRGGAAPDIYLLNLQTRESRNISNWKGVDLRPMWSGTTLYYLSDAGSEGRINIWSYHLATQERKQETRFGEYDVRHASIGGDAIVFQYGAEIHRFDLRTGNTAPIRISFPRTESAPRTAEVDASRFTTARQLASGGERVLFEARGDIWVAPAKGKPANLTNTPGVFEREAALSCDGRRISYWSDASGEYQLYIRPAGEGSASGPLTKFGEGFRYRPVWSRDDRYLAFVDQRGAIFIHDVVAGTTEEIDRDTWAELPELAWSPDSSWLAYTRTPKNRLGALWRHDVRTRTSRQITSDVYYSSTPVFDGVTGHLIFISYRNYGSPLVDWISQRIAHRALGMVMRVPLAAIDSATDWREVERQASRVNAGAGSILALGVAYDGDPVYAFTDLAGKTSVRRFDLESNKDETIADGSSEFSLSPDGTHVLLQRDGAYVSRDLRSGAETATPTDMKMSVDLRAEWRQLFLDAWRIYRDFFFAPKSRGAFDWNDVRRRCAPLIEAAATRDDVNWILSEMIGEVGVGHAYVGSAGDIGPRPPASSVGMLGADFVLEGAAYRIARLYEGAPWDDQARSPLPGVSEGEYLLAVDGKPIDVAADIRAAFVDTVSKEVAVTVGPDPVINSRSRIARVTPIASENDLRYRSWVYQNRLQVERATGGRAGYIHIPDFTTAGYSEFARQFHGQTAAEGLIIDARWSTGGWVGGVVAETLARPPLNYAASRFSDEVWPVPRWGAQFGSKAFLVNHFVVSAGENFAYYFRKLGLGPLVGARTWGGLTGLNPVPALIDGGSVNVPNAPFFDGGDWIVEGHGLEPDVVVSEHDPDAQLTAAIKALLKEMDSRPSAPPRAP